MSFSSQVLQMLAFIDPQCQLVVITTAVVSPMPSWAYIERHHPNLLKYHCHLCLVANTDG